MTSSRATLALGACGGATRALYARAEAPQRWSLANGKWGEATHQVLGDGVHGGETLRTSISLGPNARAVIRAAAPTSLRGPAPSLWITRVGVARGARLLFLPGALIPHLDSAHAQSTRVDVAEGGAALLSSVIVPGRGGMGEHGAFRSLRVRTTARVARHLVAADDVMVRPASLSPGNSGLFGQAGALVGLLAIGDWPPSDPLWWQQFACLPATLGVSRLRSNGTGVRAACASLGDALELVAAIEQAARPTAL